MVLDFIHFLPRPFVICLAALSADESARPVALFSPTVDLLVYPLFEFISLLMHFHTCLLSFHLSNITKACGSECNELLFL